MLYAVKSALRIEQDDSTHNDELSMLVESAKGYIKGAGVPDAVVDGVTDERVKHLVVIYCRSMFENNPLPLSFELILKQLYTNTSEAVVI